MSELNKKLTEDFNALDNKTKILIEDLLKNKKELIEDIKNNKNKGMTIGEFKSFLYGVKNEK